MDWLEVIKGLIRHVLTAGGGVLVTNGYVGQSDLEAGVGAVIVLVGIVWSIAHKKKET